jgi:hypothetical protein
MLWICAPFSFRPGPVIKRYVVPESVFVPENVIISPLAYIPLCGPAIVTEPLSPVNPAAGPVNVRMNRKMAAATNRFFLIPLTGSTLSCKIISASYNRGYGLNFPVQP